MNSKYTKGVLILSLAIGLLFSSCTNLDNIYHRLDEHDKRLENLEQLVKSANENIRTIEKLIAIEQQKVFIVSYKLIDEKVGYELILSDGSKLILKNGSDGSSPAINVKKHTDGLYYWTIDGEFMHNANGEMIKAEGVDGSAGITPKLRVSTDGYWEVSNDGGKSWTAILDTEGNPIQAEGKDATIDLSITENEDAIIIIYNGQTFVISKNSGTPPSPTERPILAIDYVAEFNINTEGTDFTSSHANNNSGYFSWDEAIKLFAIDKDFTINNKKYHLPSQEEWRGIVPEYNGGKNVRFDEAIETLNVTEKISIGGAPTKVFTSDYKSLGKNISYGLRYKDESNNQLSAWRYALVTNPDGGLMMTITVRYLGPKMSSLTINKISNEDWWNSNNDDYDIIRTFPLTGIRREDGSKTGVNDYAMYWLSTEGNATTAYNMYIYSGGAHSDYSYSGKVFGTPIRLLLNEYSKPEKPLTKLPLENMSEYNIATDGISFVDSYSNKISGYFTWQEAMDKFQTIDIEGKKYHLPSIAEWRGIINDSKLNFKDRELHLSVEEEIQIGKDGTIKKYYADYSSPEDQIVYGLRYKGIDEDNNLLSAWRYQYVRNPNSKDHQNMLVIITARLLGAEFIGSINDINSSSFWENNNKNDVIRYIPMSGWKNSAQEVQMLGSNARFFSSTSTSGYCWYAFFTSYSVGLMDTMNDWYYDLKDLYTVRLFED